MKIEITEKFRVWVPVEGGPEKMVEFAKGQVIDSADVPANQTAQDWIAKGLAKAVHAASAGDELAREDGAAV